MVVDFLYFLAYPLGIMSLQYILDYNAFCTVPHSLASS
jgi:hypothetical protein